MCYMLCTYVCYNSLYLCIFIIFIGYYNTTIMYTTIILIGEEGRYWAHVYDYRHPCLFL